VALRQIAPVTLVLAITIAGFVGARALGEREARHGSEHRAELAATQIHSSLNQAADLVEGFRRLLVGHVGGRVTSGQFADLGASVLRAVDLSAAAWVEQVPAAGRAAYEHRVGRIVAQTASGRIAPAGPRPVYLPATLVTGYAPTSVPGVDLAGEPGLAAAVNRVQALYSVTSVAQGADGLILLEAAQRVDAGSIEPGFVVLFVPGTWLLERESKAAGTQMLQLRFAGASFGDPVGDAPSRSAFSAFGQRFEVLVPGGPVHATDALLPWIVLGVGVLLAAFTGALGVNTARRARAQRDLDRVFTLSSDLIAISSFDGRVRRVNPAGPAILGYTEEELLERPFLEFVHPDDVERTVANAEAMRRGEKTVALENRILRKDGSYRWLEWTSIPVAGEQLVYSVGRDVTDRRNAEAEEAALRRVATLVARGVRPTEVFDAVAAEVRGLLGADVARVMRYGGDGTGTVVAASDPGLEIPVGTRFRLEGDNVAARVLRTGRPARIDDYEDAPGELAALLSRQGIRSSVGTPILVEGRFWGVTVAAWRERQEQAVLAGTERRLVQFTELVATAIANAETRAELTASRARVVAAADETRRRIERDLHDGTQQRLVSLALELRTLQAAMPSALPDLEEQVGRVAADLGEVLEELRELSRGIHPGVLSEGGLGPALRTLARRSAVPVELDLQADKRFPVQIEVAAYYVVSEALTNAAKHARASAVWVDLAAENGLVRLSIRDDGVGGADPARGTGLVGLRDRVEALGGTIEIGSRTGSGTWLVVTLPVAGEAAG
jgi:PAS domain S-box-containing protein